MLLNSTAKLEFSVDGVGAAAGVVFTAWAVNDDGSALTPVFSSGTSNGTTAVDIIAAPAASNTRTVKHVLIRNEDGTVQSRTVTVRVDVSGTDRRHRAVTLYQGETLEYDGTKWLRYNANGYLMQGLYALRAAVGMPPHFSTANLTSVKTITSGSTFAVYIGKAPRTYLGGETINLRCRVTTAMATITWGEVAIATGAVVVGGNPTLTTRGWANVSAVFNSTGQKTVAIPVDTAQTIQEGEDVWLLIGNQATTAAIMRAVSIADDLQVGLQGSSAMRPSLNIGVGQVFTIEGATTLAAWVALIW